MSTWQIPNVAVAGSKMRHFPTKVINVIGGPGSDKSLVASAIILNLNLQNKTVEHVADYAKSLVWQKDMEALKNQYFIAQQQYKMLKLLDGELQYLVTEGSLAQSIYYNKCYKENICDIQKTEKQIKTWYNEFDNINIFVQRSDKKYITTGRYQNEEEALEVDRTMANLLHTHGIPFTVLPPDIHQLNEFINKMLHEEK